MNKRITAFITGIAMLLTLCVCTSVFAENDSAAANDAAYDEAVTLLSALGVNSLSVTDKNVTYNVFYDALSNILSQGGAALDISDLTVFRSAVRRATQVLHTRTRCAVL